MPFTPIQYAVSGANGLPNNGRPWTTPNNAAGAPDTLTATRITAANNQASDGLEVTFPAIIIPVGGTLAGLQFTSRIGSLMGIHNWTIDRAAVPTGLTMLTNGGLLSDLVRGSTSNLFGWTLADINAGLVMQLVSTQSGPGGATSMVDAVGLEAFYTLPVTGNRRRRIAIKRKRRMRRP